MSTNEQVEEFMRCLEAGDIEGCVGIAKVVYASERDFESMLSEPMVKTSAAILSAFSENEWISEYFGDYCWTGYDSLGLSQDAVNAVTETDPNWYQHDYFIEHEYLGSQAIIDKCEALGWGSSETLRFARCKSVGAARIIDARTTRQDVRDALISHWSNEYNFRSYVISTETLIQSGRFNHLLVTRLDFNDPMVPSLLGELEAAHAYIEMYEEVDRTMIPLLLEHNDPEIDEFLLREYNICPSSEKLVAWAGHSDWTMRNCVARNSNTPVDTLKSLVFDDNITVVRSARSTLRDLRESIPTVRPGTDNYGFVLGVFSEWWAGGKSASVIQITRFVADLESLLAAVSDVPTTDERAQFAAITEKVMDRRDALREEAAGLDLAPMELDDCLAGLVGTANIQRRYNILRDDIAKLANRACETSKALTALEATLTSVLEK